MALALLLGKISPKSSSGVPIIPSYLLSLIVAAIAVAFFDLDKQGVKIVGEIPTTLPPISMPLFDWELIRTLSPGAVAVALIGFAEATSSAKVVASFGGYNFSNDRELVGQGLAKIATAFFSGIPVSGSPSRTLLNYRAGAATRYANVFSAIFVTVIVLFFGGIAGYIPMAGLAGIVVLIAATMVDIPYIKLAIHSTTADTLALIATFAAALFFPLDFAIYIGVGVSLVLFLRKVRRPRIIEMCYDETEGLQELTNIRSRSFPEIAILHVEGDVFFGGVDYLEEEIQKIISGGEVKVLILRMKRAFHLDATAIYTLMKIYRDLKRQNKLMIISGVTKEVERVFHGSEFEEVVGEENIYHAQKTLFQSTMDALNHALEYVNATCGKEYKPVDY
jgi:SulP family sulfate permease